MTITKPEGIYRFHNPNTEEDTAKCILEIFTEVCRPKIERAIREKLQQNPEQKSLRSERCYENGQGTR